VTFSITLFRCNPFTRVLHVSPRHEFDAGLLSFVIELSELRVA
jgi:hypothetical protein